MPEPAENYVPQMIAKGFRSQAYRVWSITLAVVFAWVLLTVLAPATRANGIESAASPLYSFFSYICHQIPERSMFLFGHQLGVCSRCFGVYFGLFLGVLLYPLWRDIDDIEPLARVWLLLSLVPIGIDWSLTFFGIWENTLLSRFITGSILGAACSVFIVPALVEIVRNFSVRKTTSRIVD